MNYNAHARLRTILIVGLLAALCLAGCGQSYADEGQMKAFAANSAHGETVEFVNAISERRLHFRTKERGVEFDVWTFEKEIMIDGSHVCYTDDYGIADNYEDGVYNYYKQEIESLIAAAGLQATVYSPQYDRLSAFTLAIDENIADEQANRIREFFAGLRDIAVREAKLHTDGFGLKFPCSIVLHTEDGRYVELKAAGGGELVITAATTDAQMDFRNFARGDHFTENVTAPTRNGVLFEVRAQ